jgi:hypothetical protein
MMYAHFFLTYHDSLSSGNGLGTLRIDTGFQHVLNVRQFVLHQLEGL